MRFSASRRALMLASTCLISGALVLSACSAPNTDKDAAPAAAAAKRTVEHARGKTEVSAKPQRVVTLEPVETDTVAALGVTPVGVAVLSSEIGIPKYLGFKDVKVIGTHTEPDLEAIAALKPDLILGTESRHSKLYDKLNAIAPTVYMRTQTDPWQQNALLVGEAMNRRQDVQNLLDGYTKRCETIKETYKAKVAGKTGVLIRPFNETTLRLYGPTTMAGVSLKCVGLAPLAREWKEEQAKISPENVLQAKADFVFVSSAKPEDPSTIPAGITANKAAFPSVKLVDLNTWVFGEGIKGGNAVLDDIEQVLKQSK